ncbi:MAG: response regulator [Planctomycetales bacterium]|nr:response regulator [Planctomycetales bacterium]
MNDTKSILVVDDDEDIAANMNDILSDMGYRVDVAHNGETALSHLTRKAYDIALLDYKMPDVDGATLFSQMKLLQPGLAAIMITAFANSEDVRRATSNGVTNVLRKPVDLPQLFESIADVCDRPLVLIIDDDDDFSHSLEDILREHNYRVGRATDVAQANECLATLRFDVVVLDLRLGNHTAEKIQFGGNQWPTAILTTGYTSEMSSLIKLLQERGVKAVHRKPVDTDDLLRDVSNVAQSAR